MTKHEIRARVLTEWSHRNCKFFPGDTVEVRACHSSESNVIRGRVGQEGKVVAVSSADGINIRGDYSRAFTRYYVEFADGQCSGIHSHYLAKCDK